MRDAVVVVGCVVRHGCARERIELEVDIGAATLGVIPVDGDVLVAVEARVLVVEAEPVQNLVHDGAGRATSGRQRDGIGAALVAESAAAVVAAHEQHIVGLVGARQELQAHLAVNLERLDEQLDGSVDALA